MLQNFDKMMMLCVVLKIAMITASAFISTAFLGSRPFVDTPNLSLGKSVTNENSIVLQRDMTLELPIFPLRKSVRLPTDALKLNLYEERYLAMSEFILKQDRPVFGALYASDKPQIVKGGQGPIVPMLDVGDIGVLCFVKEWEEGMVPTQDPSFSRRRIRLNALAVGRFRIEEILNDGTRSPRSKDSPFIMVKASLVTDNKAVKADDIESDLWRLVEAQRPINTSENERVESLVDEITSLVSYMDYAKGDQRTEVFSFAAASMISAESGLSPVLRQSVLELVSIDDRLRKISEWL